MKNIKFKKEGDILTVTIDLSKDLGMSKSQKSRTIATTEGNVSIDDDSDVKIGVNCYRPAGEAK